MYNVGWSNRFVALAIGVVCALLFMPFTRFATGGMSKITAPKEQVYTVESDPSGVGPIYPDYWVKEDFWVGETCPVNTAVKEQAEQLLARLDADNISKTAVICMPAGSVTIPGEWAKRFGKYYNLGLADGPRKDNGFVWLMLYNEAGQVEVHMAIGDGMQSLGSYELGNVKRVTEAAFDPSLSQVDNLAKAIAVLTESYNTTARANIQPWNPQEPQFGGPIEQESNSSVLLCLGLLAIFIWLTLGSEPILAFFVFLFGAVWAWEAMAWPLHVLRFAAEAASSSGRSGTGGRTGGTGSRSSGKSLGGGGGFTRTR